MSHKEKISHSNEILFKRIQVMPGPVPANIISGNTPVVEKRKRTNYHSIFNQASDAIYICDITGNFIDVNASFCRMFGYTAKEFLHLNITDVMEPEELKARPIAFARVATGEHLIGQRRMVTKAGEILDMEINIKKYSDDCVLAIARDVTELRNTQKMIQVSEERFRGAFEHSSIGMALVSVSGEWLKVNKELCHITGYTEDEQISLSFRKITHPDDIEVSLQYVQRALKGEFENYNTEKRYIHKNGSIVWVNLNATLVRNDQSQPLYFVSQIENITNRKKSEEALKKSEANLQVIFDNTDTGYALVDKELTIIAYNKYAADFAKNETGVEGKLGDNLSGFFLEERRPLLKNVIPKVLKGESVNYEAGYPQPDGSVNWYYVRLYPVGGSDEKEIFGLMLAIDDITKRKKDELEREKIANDLIIRNKDLEKFTHILSHNVRSHVASLMGLTDLLMKYELNEHENKEMISGISQSVKSLDKVVRDLNDILQLKSKI